MTSFFYGGGGVEGQQKWQKVTVGGLRKWQKLKVFFDVQKFLKSFRRPFYFLGNNGKKSGTIKSSAGLCLGGNFRKICFFLLFGRNCKNKKRSTGFLGDFALGKSSKKGRRGGGSKSQKKWEGVGEWDQRPIFEWRNFWTAPYRYLNTSKFWNYMSFYLCALSNHSCVLRAPCSYVAFSKIISN